MGKARCPQCGSTEIEITVKKVGAPAVCRRCGARLRAKRAAGEQSASPMVAENEVLAHGGSAAKAPTVYVGDGKDPEAIRRVEADDHVEWHAGDIILDLYEVTGLLGEGGMGKVYKVRHRGWDVDLAVKTPLPEVLQEAGGPEIFKREAETWINLGLHPHVVSCYYVRDLGGIPRVFAEYIEGGSLSDWVKDRRLYAGGPVRALERILDISIQFAWGLHYAHEQGLVHQDVKPANVMMTAEGTAKVTDFGLAGVKGAPGTPAYRSPEQEDAAIEKASGTESQCLRKLDMTSDLWSWGVSILEMFTGEVTWMSGRAAPAVLEDWSAAGWGDSIIPRMPEAVETLLKSCFTQTQSKRPRNLLQAARTLREAYQQITGKPYVRPEPTAATDSPDSLNNRAVSMLDLGRCEDAERLLEQALTVQSHHPEATFNQGLIRWRNAGITDVDVVTAMQEMLQSHEHNPVAALLLSRIHRERGDLHQAVETLESFLKTASGTQELRVELERLRSERRETVTITATWKGGPSSYYGCPAMSRDGRHVVTTGPGDEALELHDGRTGSLIRRFDSVDDIITTIFVSDDGGQILAGTKNGRIGLWDAKSGRPLRNFEGHTKAIRSACLSSDGNHVLSGSEDGTARLWNAGTGQLIRILDDGPVAIECVCFSGDGRYAVTAGWSQARSANNPMLRLWEVNTGRRAQTFFSPEGRREEHARVVCLSHDGKLLLTGRKEVKAWDTATGECMRTFKRHPHPVAYLRMTLDGDYVWCGTQAGKLELLEVSTGRCVSSRWFLPNIDRLLLREEDFSFPLIHMLIPSADARYVLHSRGMMDSHDMWSLGTVRPRQAPFALCRVVASEQALDVDRLYTQCLASATASLSRSELEAAAAMVRTARALPGCSRRPEAMQTWKDLHRRLPRTQLKGGWSEATFRGLPDGTRSASLSRDGRFGLAGCTDGQIRIWELDSGTCTHELQFARLWEYDEQHVCLSGNGRYLVAGSTNSTLVLYDLRAGKRLRQGDPLIPSRIGSLGVSHDDRFALVCGETREGPAKGAAAHLFHLPTGRRLRRFHATKGNVATASLSHDNRHALLCSYDCRVDLYDVAEGTLVRSFDLDDYGARTVAALFVGAGRTAVIAVNKNARGLTDSEQLVLLDTTDGSVRGVAAGVSGIRHSGQLTLDGRHGVAVDSVSSSIVLWDLRSGECLRRFDDLQGGGLSSVCISADGRHLLRGLRNGDVNLWTLDWELEDQRQVAWDDGALPYLRAFLDQRVPYAGDLPVERDPSEEEIARALTRCGRPTWTDDDFNHLLYTLACVGYGWLSPDGVKRKLEETAKTWGDPA